MWAALFGALGFNFLQLGFDPPESMSSGGATGWIVCGVVFWLMALGGLIPGLMALGSYFKDSANPEEAEPIFDAPIVRANVRLRPQHAGRPDVRQVRSRRDEQAAASEQAPEQRIESTNDFVDPVTGERSGGNDG